VKSLIRNFFNSGHADPKSAYDNARYPGYYSMTNIPKTVHFRNKITTGR